MEGAAVMGIGTIIVIIVAVAAAVGVLIWAIVTSNKFKMMKVKINEAASSIDVALTKRFDVLTKELETVKGYAKHEADTLGKVVELRAGMSMKEKAAVNQQYEEMAKGLSIMVENYPDLKASANFKQLQVTIFDTEEQLQASRRMYNANVSKYNQSIVIFPNSIIANMTKCIKADFFEAEEKKRADVEMKF